MDVLQESAMLEAIVKIAELHNVNIKIIKEEDINTLKGTNNMVKTALEASFTARVTAGKGVTRVTSDSKTGRQFLGQFKQYEINSNHTPHIGIKQQERQIKQKQKALAKQAKKQNLRAE